MPYIKQSRRKVLDRIWSEEFDTKEIKDSGELNYLLSRLVDTFLYRNGEFKYQDLNDVVGALEGCKLEFVRRIVTPYEIRKISENGDI